MGTDKTSKSRDKHAARRRQFLKHVAGGAVALPAAMVLSGTLAETALAQVTTTAPATETTTGPATTTAATTTPPLTITTEPSLTTTVFTTPFTTPFTTSSSQDVPEPATAALLASGIAGAYALNRALKKRRDTSNEDDDET